MPTMTQALLYPKMRGRDVAPTPGAPQRPAYAPLEGFEGGGFSGPGFGFKGYTPVNVGFGALKGLLTGGPVGAGVGALTSGFGMKPGDTGGFQSYGARALPGAPGSARHTQNMPGARARRDQAEREARTLSDRSTGPGGRSFGGGYHGR